MTKRIVITVSLGFVFLVALKIHGFSLPMWHKIIDQSKPTECLLGSRPQHIRSDDWALFLPTMLAQVAHVPKFPVKNTNLWFGENMLLPISAPVWHSVLFFQPQLWGFVLGADHGLSWLWWSLVIGLFLSWYFLFKIITKDEKLSLFLSLALAFSPQFQLWSFHKTEIAIAAACIILALIQLVQVKSALRSLLWGGLLAWASGFLIWGHVYPPFQVSVGYLILMVGFSLALPLVKQNPSKRVALLGVLLAAVVLGVALLNFYQSAADAIATLTATEYPGKRRSVGGGWGIHLAFSNLFFIRHWVKDWLPLGNICEAALGFYFFPAVALVHVCRWIHTKKADFLSFALVGYAVLLLFYASSGLPETLANATFLSRLTSNRISMGLTLIDFILLARLLANYVPLPFKMSLICSLLYGNFLFFIGREIDSGSPEMPWLIFYLAPIFWGCYFLILSTKERPARAVAFLAALSFIYTMSFNPYVRGGSEFLVKNPLSVEITRLNKEDPKGVWISFGENPMGQILAVLGVPSIPEYQGIPNLEFWKSFDPSGKSLPVYNYSGFATFLPSDGSEPEFKREMGNMVVQLPVDYSAFAKWNVKYYLADEEAALKFDQSKNFTKRFSYSKFTIYSRTSF